MIQREVPSDLGSITDFIVAHGGNKYLAGPLMCEDDDEMPYFRIMSGGGDNPFFMCLVHVNDDHERMVFLMEISDRCPEGTAFCDVLATDLGMARYAEREWPCPETTQFRKNVEEDMGADEQQAVN